MLSTSTSNSSFLNGNIDGNYADTDDRLQILRIDCETREDFREPLPTKMRKIAFIASIASTCIVIIVFLLLPCNGNCVAKHHPAKLTKTINWLKNYEKLELKGSINTIGSKKDSSSLNLIFMYRNDKIFPDSNARKSKQKSNGGIIAMNGNTGEVAWQNEMTNEPRSIDCSLIDCDNNGVNDCLVLDEFGQLTCIDFNGHWIYYNSNAKATKQIRRDLLDFPLILPDLNDDNVYEIMMGSYSGKNNSTNLILLSGSNGKTLAEETLNCTYIHKLQLDSDYVIKFICMVKENIEQQVFKNLTDFYGIMMSKKPVKSIKELQPVSSIQQHKYFGRRASINAQTIITNVHDKELIIENKGLWPRESKTSIKLTSNESGVKKVYYNYTGSRLYAFTPVPFSLNATSSRGRNNNNNIHGFVIKLWIWNGTEITKRGKIKRDLKTQRSNYTNQTVASASVFKTETRFLKESILLIVFNKTHMRAENASQSNIVQICRTAASESLCQPDLSYQENSLIITDIDGDGSKELVSYYSTFFDENHEENSKEDRWKLKTYIQLFKLETELPKLYGSEYDIF